MEPNGVKADYSTTSVLLGMDRRLISPGHPKRLTNKTNPVWFLICLGSLSKRLRRSTCTSRANQNAKYNEITVAKTHFKE